MSDASHRSLLQRYGLPPDEIYRRSFATVEALLDQAPTPQSQAWSAAERQVVARIIHASGDPDLAPLVRFSTGAVAAGVAALRQGAPIFTDVRMVAAGVNERLASAAGCAVHTLIARAPHAGAMAGPGAALVTRSAAAIEAALPELAGAIVAIGNAPTALLALLDALDEGRCAPPAIIIGMPVGFIATRESKAALLERPFPAISIEGTRGGSPAAAATVNALLALATQPGASTPADERASGWKGVTA